MAPPRKSHADLVAAMREHVTIETQKGPVRAAVEDGGTDLALARAAAAAEAGRPLRGTERREVRREVMAAHTAAQPQQRRPSLRERLERMTEPERLAAVEKVTPGTRERAYMEHLVRSIEEVEYDADLLAAQQNEEAWLAAQDDEPEPSQGSEWTPEWTPGLSPAEALEVEHDAAIADPWGSAQASLAAEESEFSDSIEDGYVEEDYFEGDEAA